MEQIRFRNVKDEYKELSSEKLKEIYTQSSFEYANLVFNVVGSLNVGNIIRSSNLCGCRKVVVFGQRTYDKRSCVGSNNYIDIERISGLRHIDKIGEKSFYNTLSEEDCDLDPEIFIQFIKENNYVPIFVEQHETSLKLNKKNIHNIVYESQKINKIPIFIYGNESFGIPKNILDTRHKFDLYFILELEQMGIIRSHNVSNTCAIVSYKVMKTFMKND